MTAPSRHSDMDDRLRAHRRHLLIGSIVAVSIVVAAVWALTILHPMPPRTVTMTTGPEGGACHESGKRYREIQAAFIVASWESPVVRRLVASGKVELASFYRADALVALYPYLNKLVVPAGVGDMAGNRPPADVAVLAPETSLVVRNDLHPAIQALLLDAATEVHSGPGVFQKAGRFPAAEPVDLPLSDPAHRYYKSGRPFLQRYLPFWAAAFLEQLLVLLMYTQLLFALRRDIDLMRQRIGRSPDAIRRDPPLTRGCRRGTGAEELPGIAFLPGDVV